MKSPIQEHGPVHGATSGYTAPDRRASSPVIDEPSEQLEHELAGTRFPGRN
jgi:mitogen-activated protein kinase 7